MDASCLKYTLTEEERRAFKEQGYLIIPDVLPTPMVSDLVQAVDRVDAEERARMGHAPDDRINHYDFIGKDDRFLEPLDWYRTFPKVWGLMGWHIQLYHTHLTVTPPAPQGQSLEHDGYGLGWHQDSGMINQDFDQDPRPMVSLKVAFFLTDTSETGRGNFYVIPGSHTRNKFPGEDRNALHPEGIPVLAPAGSAVFFDRRIWHSASANYWTEARRVLFYGYSYRWLRPRDDMQVAHYLDRCDPIRKQLLGVSYSGGRGFTSPTPADVPLRTWLEEQGQVTK
ncbi:MAG: phytanoyl-CoA dioxygenase family protein [bacterium]|jgi:ectoine hydroxylase|nr:phytanoyl-CoA dioxygenase family protein [bacterium]